MVRLALAVCALGMAGCQCSQEPSKNDAKVVAEPPIAVVVDINGDVHMNGEKMTFEEFQKRLEALKAEAPAAAAPAADESRAP